MKTPTNGADSGLHSIQLVKHTENTHRTNNKQEENTENLGMKTKNSPRAGEPCCKLWPNGIQNRWERWP